LAIEQKENVKNKINVFCVKMLTIIPDVFKLDGFKNLLKFEKK